MSSRPRPTDGGGPFELPTPPAVAQDVLGSRLGAMQRYAAILATRGVDHGLLGPREVPRLWERHIVNCALISQLIPADARVIDVGSGAGLPGLVLALARPDLRVDLVEPLERRVRWLQAAIAELHLQTVAVHSSRAESLWGSLSGDIVTARAVARLSDLTRWCLPLVPVAGELLAIKGATAHREIEEDRAEMEEAGAGQIGLLTLGEDIVQVPTRVVRVVRGHEVVVRGASGRIRRGRRAADSGSTTVRGGSGGGARRSNRRRADGRGLDRA